MKIEVGKTYFARDGVVVLIVGRSEMSSYPFLGDNEIDYTECGRQYIYNTGPNDLVSALKEELSREDDTYKGCRYVVVEEAGLGDLECSVNDLIDHGYMPIGGVSEVHSKSYGDAYKQAMYLA